MNNYRLTLETFKKKLELASHGSTKELRLNKQEVVDFHQALVSLMLINAELMLTNEELRRRRELRPPTNDLDGGGF